MTVRDQILNALKIANKSPDVWVDGDGNTTISYEDKVYTCCTFEYHHTEYKFDAAGNLLSIYSK